MISRLREAQDDGGFTLIEMLVAMLISAMVLAMAGAFFVNVAKLTNAAKVSRQGMGQASLAIDAIRNVVTMAADNTTSDAGATTPAVVAGTGTTLTVISYANTVASAVAPSQVTYTIDASGYLTETRVAAVAASTGYWAFSGAATSRKIAGPFITATGTPFFSYINATGGVISLTPTGLATTDLSNVAFVRVTAKVDATSARGSAPPLVISTSIGLTNLYRNVDDAVSLPSLSGGQ